MHSSVQRLISAVPTRLVSAARIRSGRSDHGQATAEYALVILGAAALATLVLAWASKTSAVGDLFDAVLNSVADRVS